LNTRPIIGLVVKRLMEYQHIVGLVVKRLIEYQTHIELCGEKKD